jgi:hypothetical protein
MTREAVPSPREGTKPLVERLVPNRNPVAASRSIATFFFEQRHDVEVGHELFGLDQVLERVERARRDEPRDRHVPAGQRDVQGSHFDAGPEYRGAAAFDGEASQAIGKQQPTHHDEHEEQRERNDRAPTEAGRGCGGRGGR